MCIRDRLYGYCRCIDCSSALSQSRLKSNLFKKAVNIAMKCSRMNRPNSQKWLLALHIGVCCISVVPGFHKHGVYHGDVAVRDKNVYYKCTYAGAVFVERAGEDGCLLLLASEWLYCMGWKLSLYVQIRLVTRTESIHTPESIQSLAYILLLLRGFERIYIYENS